MGARESRGWRQRLRQLPARRAGRRNNASSYRTRYPGLHRPRAARAENGNRDKFRKAPSREPRNLHYEQRDNTATKTSPAATRKSRCGVIQFACCGGSGSSRLVCVTPVITSSTIVHQPCLIARRIIGPRQKLLTTENTENTGVVFINLGKRVELRECRDNIKRTSLHGIVCGQDGRSRAYMNIFKITPGMPIAISVPRNRNNSSILHNPEIEIWPSIIVLRVLCVLRGNKQYLSIRLSR